MIQEPLGIQQIGHMLIPLSQPFAETKLWLAWEICVLGSHKAGTPVVLPRHLETQ